MFWSNKRKSHNNTVHSDRAVKKTAPRHAEKNTEKFVNINLNIDFSVNARHSNEPSQLYGAYMMLQKKEPHIITASDSAVGTRPDQQDCCYVTKSTSLSPFKLKRTFAIVCDGMGGLEAGDRASLTAVSMMKLAVSKLPTKKVDIPHFYHDMLQNIDYEINHWDDLKTDKGAGTTLVSVLIENRRLYWASVGDSTIFMIQDNQIKRITREHNYKMCLEELVSGGKITRQQADSDPQQNALVSYLGMGGLAYMDITSKPYILKDGDMLLLCSDGVTNTLTEDELLQIVTENSEDVYQCCKEITRNVVSKNKELQDNATVVAVQYVE